MPQQRLALCTIAVGSNLIEGGAKLQESGQLSDLSKLFVQTRHHLGILDSATDALMAGDGPECLRILKDFIIDKPPG